MHCKASFTSFTHKFYAQVLRTLSNSNQGNGSEWAFAARSYKLNLKNLKPSYDGWFDAVSNLKASII